MTPLIFAGYVTYLLFGSVAYSAALTPSNSLRLELVDIGQEVTLTCFYRPSGMVVYWYKQSQGQIPELVSELLMHTGKASLKGKYKDDPRFVLKYGDGKNHLMISNVQMSDSGTYYCASGQSFMHEFLEGIIVHVKDSGLIMQTLVHQSGGSVSLNCSVQSGTCDREHSVCCFKHSEESLPNIIFTHGDNFHQCDLKPQTHKCVCNLTLKNLNGSHAGTYYCAVASCGHLQFGNGTKLDFEEKADSPVLLYILSGSLAFSIILVFSLLCVIYKLHKEKRCTCKGPPNTPSAPSTPNAESTQDADLHYAALSERKVGGSGSQMNTNNDCVYSSIRQ